MSRRKSAGIREGEPAKTPKVWEKARREKMKIYFNELQEVLPLYDPSAPMSRFEVLQKSRTYIKELQCQNQDLLNGGFDEVYKSKMEKLKQRVKELLQRVDQLTDLLRRANIMIPPLVPCNDKQESLCLSQKWMNQRPKKWTEKINVVVPDEKIENILSMIKDFKKKNNKVSKKPAKNYEKQYGCKGSELSGNRTTTFSERIELKRKKQLKKIKSPTNSKTSERHCDKNDKKSSDTFPDSQSPSHTKENQPVDFNLPNNQESAVEETESANKNSQDEIDSEKNNTGNKSEKTIMNEKVNVVSEKVKNLIESHSNVFLPASTNVVQSNTFLLTNDGNLVQFPILNSSGNVFGANANLLTQATIVNQGNSSLLTPLVINRPSPVIVLQKPAPQIIQAAQIVNQPQILNVPNPNIQIVGNSIVCATSSQNTKTLPYIMSKQPPYKKRIAKDSTMTTFVNKIPIPALSKQSYVKKSVSLGTCVGVKAKNASSKAKDAKEKANENEKNETEGEMQSNEKESQTEKCSEPQENEEEVNTTEKEVISVGNEGSQKRNSVEEEGTNPKKQKVIDECESGNNVFKPIEHPILPDPPVPNDGLFCSLKLSTSMGNNLSVSPTAAFLSTFPIVASSKYEDELAVKIDDRRTDDKEGKITEYKSKEKEIVNNTSVLPEVSSNKECSVSLVSKEPSQTEPDKEQRNIDKQNCDMSIVSNLTSTNTNGNSKQNEASSINGSNSMVSVNRCQQLMNTNKSWDEYQKTCEARSDPFYVHTDVQNPVPPPVMPDVPNSTFPDPIYKNSYPQNNLKTNFNVQNTLSDQMLKNDQFDYGQKESFGGKKMGYAGDRGGVKKFSNAVNESYLSKNQPAMYQGESTPNYQLFPAKEMPNQRNSRPPVNWMTDPDVRSRSMNYGTAKIPPYTQPDIFYMNNQKPQSDVPNDCILTDVNKVNYQKNDFYSNKNMDMQMKIPDQRCKNIDKRSDAKFPAKMQNSYNIFDYNYNGNYFTEEEGNKFCEVQNFQSNVKNKKTNTTAMTKKKDAVQLINPEQSETAKRNSDQIITNIDFNPVGNQECFSWVPGKNVEWLPSKSFVDTNLILPSTLPTLVGDLALGTTTSNETPKGTNRSNQTKNTIEATGKMYIDIGFGNNASFSKDPAIEGNKQYLEPFTNLSKNIFDVTPSNNMQNPQLSKNDCDKNGYLGNANETIVLKNIFELPVSKSFNDFSNRNKQRPVNNTQNTFLSVSQLVETPNYDNNIKNEGTLENGVTKPSEYAQNFNTYHGSQKTYKNKTRNYKYNERKYQTYKNTSSNYTAEALIRSNANLPYQSNDFQPEVNTNFYSVKTTQKIDTFPANDAKSDFIPCSTQNIYTDFNFSSPVPNFNISTSVSADYVTHDNNFSAQNNTFFGDFIPPEYPITESVSNSLLLPPCSIGLQNPFIIEKRNGTPEKSKTQVKHYSNSRSRKNFDCSKPNYSDFSIHNTSSGIFTNASITCPTIFTTTSCQNLLPVPNQNIPDPNITFSASSFTTSNITFPPLTSNANTNYHRPTTCTNNAATTTFFPTSCHSMLTTCSTTTISSSRTCQSALPPTSSSSAVITTPFSVGNTPFPPSTQSLPFLSLSNPIIPPSVPSTSGNTLANFNLSTIFPEINQKGNYHYP